MVPPSRDVMLLLMFPEILNNFWHKWIKHSQRKWSTLIFNEMSRTLWHLRTDFRCSIWLNWEYVSTHCCHHRCASEPVLSLVLSGEISFSQVVRLDTRLWNDRCVWKNSYFQNKDIKEENCEDAMTWTSFWKNKKRKKERKKERKKHSTGV